MSNIYTKSMRDALQEARDYRDDLDIDEAKGHLSYDEWLKNQTWKKLLAERVR
jgi:hypothetical protein